MVPYSANLNNVGGEGKEKLPSGPHVHIKIPMKEFGGRAHIVTFSAASAPKADKSSKPFAKELIVPFWLVRYTADKDLANMDRSTLKCTCSFTAGGEESKGDAVLIPILQNLKAIKEGDELLTYDGGLVKPTLTIEPKVPESAPAAAASAPKRQRPVKGKKTAKPKRLYQPPKKKARTRK